MSPTTRATANAAAAAPAVPVPDRPRASRRIALSILAPEGGGKTKFALSFPQPMLFIHVGDPNSEAEVEKKFKVDDVATLDPRVCQYLKVEFPIVGLGVDEAIIQREAEDAWFTIEERIRALYESRLPIPPRSVVIDSATLLDRLNTLRTFGRTNAISPKERMRKGGDANKDLVGLFDMLERARVHLCVTHRAKAHYETTSVRTAKGVEERDEIVPGVYDRLGYKEIGNLTNCEVLAKFDPEREGKVGERFGFKLLRSRQRPALIGDEFWGKDAETGLHVCTFQSLAMLLYPGTTRDDWR